MFVYVETLGAFIRVKIEGLVIKSGNTYYNSFEINRAIKGARHLSDFSRRFESNIFSFRMGSLKLSKAFCYNLKILNLAVNQTLSNFIATSHKLYISANSQILQFI